MNWSFVQNKSTKKFLNQFIYLQQKTNNYLFVNKLLFKD